MRKSQKRVKREKRRVKRYGMPLRGMDRIRREAAPRLPPQRGRCREATVGVPPIGLRPLPPVGEAGAAEGVSPCGGDVACLPNGGGVAKRRLGFPLSAFGHFPLWGKQGLPRASAPTERTDAFAHSPEAPRHPTVYRAGDRKGRPYEKRYALAKFRIPNSEFRTPLQALRTKPGWYLDSYHPGLPFQKTKS